MRILFFVHRYWPSVGGVEKYVGEMAKAVRELGCEACVVAGASGADQPEREVCEGVPVYRFPAYRSSLRSRVWLWRHRRLFTRADVISVSNTHMLEYFWSMLGPLVPRRKVFLIRHGMKCTHPVAERDRERARRSCRLAAGIAHDGAFIERWLGVKPDIVPEQGLSPEADELPKVPPPPLDSAVYVGRLEPDTGIRLYLDGVRELRRRGLERFELHVFGDGSLMSELREYAARERLPVCFHGRIAGAQEHITDHGFAFVDGRMAIQEAMVRRRLVIAAYANPLKRDYVGGEYFSPFLIPAGHGVEVAERVRFSIDHPREHEKLVERAFEFSRTLSWRRTARTYLDFWESRLSPRRGMVGGEPPRNHGVTDQ